MKLAFLQLATAQASGHPRCFTNEGKGILKENPKRCKFVSHRHYKRLIKIVDLEQPFCSKFASLTAEVNEVQEALKSSIAKLLASVTGHLAKVLEVAKKVATNMERKKLHTETNIEYGNKDKEDDVPATSVNPTQAKRVEGHSRKGKKVLSSSVNPTKDKSHPPPSFNSIVNPAPAKKGNHKGQTSIH
ncbi:PREDICTED: uncharacterized protein LOC18597342 isoform X1 [Theobroma cacao]|uniref:Uncharacterized protein LOC18597342 isoform X1 n=1 Tax=Theobroma cacao TaxID=3641 RepID=A0AB32WM91_THECC|nr:PREDICTED: uncharacterized protein LOC18597342 isoform X1 [Theobroma cacao]